MERIAAELAAIPRENSYNSHNNCNTELLSFGPQMRHGTALRHDTTMAAQLRTIDYYRIYYFKSISTIVELELKLKL